MTTSSEGRATLASIAAQAGVSLPTVSKVLNGKPDVAPSTRERVQRLLDAHNYQPVGLRGTAGQTLVDLVFTALDSAWVVEVIRGVAESGLEAVVSSMATAPDGRWANRLAGGGRRGAILVTSHLTPADLTVLSRAGVPLVVIDPVDLPSPEVPSVGATNWAGGLAATRHLADLGHTRIAAIGGPPDFLCSRARVDGYRAALERARLPVDDVLIRFGDFYHEGGYREAKALLKLPDRPTAIFAGNDEQALGVIRAAHESGLAVPDDLSVVGFDDLPIAAWSSPPLTTVRQPLADMGRAAGRMLQELIDGRPLENQRLELATPLVARGSTASPRPRR